MSTQNKQQRRSGFTLVELVVVVLIIGILAAAAAPKMFDTASEAKDSSAEQTLSVVRDAIELYKAENGSYPGTDEATFKAGLDTFLRGKTFPTCPVGNKDDSVRVQTSGATLTVSGTQSWAYDNQTGEFIINFTGYDNL